MERTGPPALAAAIVALLVVLARPLDLTLSQEPPVQLPSFQPLLSPGIIEPSPSDLPPDLPLVVAPADFAGGPPDRLTALEAEVQKLKDAAAAQDEAVTPPTIQIGGQLQLDYLHFHQDAASMATVGDVPDGLNFRRARLTASGEAYDVVEYAIGFDFANAGRPSFLDVYVGVHDLPTLGTVRVGHFFEPFSLERNTQNRYLTFMERSLPQAFAPGRNAGINAHNTYGPEDNGTWSVGWFASNSDNFGDQFADAGQALTARVTWLPYYEEQGRSYAHVGAGFSHRTPPAGSFAFLAFPEAQAGAPNGNIPPFVSTGIIAAENQQLLDVEYAWIRGPLSFQTEFVAVPVAQIGGPDLTFHAGYTYVSYFLTGEHRPYDKKLGIFDRVIPFENFFRVRTEEGPIATGRGAWEVAARWSYIDLTDENIQGGVLHDITLGLNWYLNPYTRVKWEYIHADLDRAPVGDSTTHIFGMRADIDF
jgi:phosphate-selective porin OprO/OprP